MSKVQVSVEALKGRRENGREFLRLGNRWGKLPFPYPCWNPPYLDLLWGEVGILHMVRSPSGPTLSPALGAVYQLLQPAIQSDLLSAVSSFYLCQSQVLCGRKGRQACARPALQIYHLGSNVHLWHPAALSSLPGFPLQSPRHEAVCAVLGARGQPVRSRRGSGKWHSELLLQVPRGKLKASLLEEESCLNQKVWLCLSRNYLLPSAGQSCTFLSYFENYGLFLIWWLL